MYKYQVSFVAEKRPDREKQIKCRPGGYGGNTAFTPGSLLSHTISVAVIV